MKATLLDFDSISMVRSSLTTNPLLISSLALSALSTTIPAIPMITATFNPLITPNKLVPNRDNVYIPPIAATTAVTMCLVFISPFSLCVLHYTMCIEAHILLYKHNGIARVEKGKTQKHPRQNRDHAPDKV